MSTEYKTTTPSGFKTTGQGAATFVIGTTGVVDSDGDVVMRGAIGDQVVTVLPAHRWDSLPLGKARVSERGDQIVAEVQFNPTPEAQSWYAAIRFDYENPPAVQQYSWGYEPTRSRPGKLDGRAVRFLDVVTMHEVSPVVIGASVGTHTAAVKQAGLSPAERVILHRARAEVDAHDAEVRDWLRSVAEGLKADLRVAQWCRYVGGAWDAELIPIGARVVAPSLREVAATAAAKYAERLGVPVPQVAWFCEPGTLSVHGLTNVATRTIMINAHQTRRQVWVTAGHEVGHIANWNEKQCREFEQFIDKEYVP